MIGRSLGAGRCRNTGCQVVAVARGAEDHEGSIARPHTIAGIRARVLLGNPETSSPKNVRESVGHFGDLVGPRHIGKVPPTFPASEQPCYAGLDHAYRPP